MIQAQENSFRFQQLFESVEKGWEIDEPVLFGAMWRYSSNANDSIYHVVLRNKIEDKLEDLERTFKYNDDKMFKLRELVNLYEYVLESLADPDCYFESYREIAELALEVKELYNKNELLYD